MRRSLKTGAASLALACLAGNVWAATVGACARPEELSAIRTAAVQQRLMVAALSCDAAPLYNSFVRTYQRELQRADRALQGFFRRVNGARGEEAYHAFKTRLANASSMESIANIIVFCESAKASFAAAMNPAKTSLAVFVSSQATDDLFAPCGFRTAAAPAAIPPPEAAPVPVGKPGATVLEAQGSSLAPPRFIEMRAINRF